MSAARLVESSAGVQAVVDHRAMALAWPLGDGRWAVQHLGEPDPYLVDGREEAKAQLWAMFAPAKT